MERESVPVMSNGSQKSSPNNAPKVLRKREHHCNVDLAAYFVSSPWDQPKTNLMHSFYRCQEATDSNNFAVFLRGGSVLQCTVAAG